MTGNGEAIDPTTSRPEYFTDLFSLTLLGTKRAADDSTSTTPRRGPKVQKTEKVSGSTNNEKKATKKPLSTTEFKSKALPLHVNLTHTPPSILKKVESEEEDVASAVVEDDDVGFIQNLTLLPSSFTTGSYGWKGSKRITVELQGGDGDGGKEKVQVMLSYAPIFIYLFFSLFNVFFFPQNQCHSHW